MSKATQSVHLEDENRECTFIVETEVSAADWEEAVRATGAMLVEAGAAEERYIDAMVEVVRELGPYIVLAPGVAMPHAGCDKGALDVAVAVARLANPVEFGSKHNDPVRTVIGFCTPEPDVHISVLRRIALVLGNNESLQCLHEATACEEVSALFVNAA